LHDFHTDGTLALEIGHVYPLCGGGVVVAVLVWSGAEDKLSVLFD
jgi:hypothetical protein